MSFKRSSGILLHPTSLPGKYGIGELGEEAYRFVDFLIASGQQLWQILPLGHTGYGDSPYQCFSTFAGNPLLISLDKLCKEGLLSKEDLNLKEPFDVEKVDYGRVIDFKYPLLRKAYSNYKGKELEAFCAEHKSWLYDYAMFMALKNHFKGRPWPEWDEDIKLRKPEALKKYGQQLATDIGFYQFLQYEFFKQWHELRAYANSKNIKIIGDVPIYVAMDSSDAWSSPSAFLFDEKMNPTKVAGVPPDYFSKTGQLWGNPLYNWEALKKTGYKWWIERVKATQELVDIIRIDHFRGFAGYWAVPYGETTAIKGKWETGPGKDLFNTIKNELGELPILAEDLGFITQDVHDLRDAFNFPSMKILQFGFDSKEGSPYVPHLFNINSVAYTGTHDNDTVLGWFEKASTEDKQYFLDYTNSDGKNVSWDFLRLAWASVSLIALAPLQDVLSLGSEARMNTPSVASGNWQWRFKWEQITSELTDKLNKLTVIYQR